MCCTHVPTCPPADASDHHAARIVVSHPEQGWNLLCNGVIAFDDTGEILPDNRVLAPLRRPLPQVVAQRSVQEVASSAA